MSAPQYGVTVLAHVEELLAGVEEVVAQARIVAPVKRLRVADREALSRNLAGAIGRLETVRLWLAAGAPR